MQLSPPLARAACLVVFAAAAVLFQFGATAAVRLIEASALATIDGALKDNAADWAQIEIDGMQVELTGTAPSEAARFNAVKTAERVVETFRVLDRIEVRSAVEIKPPTFSVEILRTADGVTLIGLAPATTDVERLAEDIAAATGAPVANFLEAADYPAPASWNDSMRFAVRSLRTLPRTKISISEGRMFFQVAAESPRDRDRIETELSQSRPAGVWIDAEVAAPRPVITPFSLRFVIGESGARFEACSADTQTTQNRIAAAARMAGLIGEARCRIGLGVPSPRWGDAAVLAIGALSKIGAGVVAFSDADVTLVAPHTVDRREFDNAAGDLEAALPDVFVLDATLTPAPDGDAPEPPEFTVTLSPEGLVQLRGKLATDADRQMVANFARARFNSNRVHMAARLSEDVPADWPLRVMAAIDAARPLSQGLVRVTPTNLMVEGASSLEEASDLISGILAERLNGGSFALGEIVHLKPPPVPTGPSAEDCEAEVSAILAERKIRFEPGKSKIAAGGNAIISDIAKALRDCEPLDMEIAGHTDSQGGESMNQRLSQQRAYEVLNELRSRRVLTSGFVATGYGETSPIADNATEEGREANRRIEFRLIRPDGPDGAQDESGGDPESAAQQQEEET